MMLIDAAVSVLMAALTILLGASVATLNDAGVAEARVASFAVGIAALTAGIIVAAIGARAALSRRGPPPAITLH